MLVLAIDAIVGAGDLRDAITVHGIPGEGDGRAIRGMDTVRIDRDRVAAGIALSDQPQSPIDRQHPAIASRQLEALRVVEVAAIVVQVAVETVEEPGAGRIRRQRRRVAHSRARAVGRGARPVEDRPAVERREVKDIGVTIGVGDGDVVRPAAGELVKAQAEDAIDGGC